MSTVLRRARRLSTPIAFVLGAVLASAGTATAAVLITGAQIQDNSVSTNDITNNSLTGTDIRNGTLDGYDLKPSGIAGGQIADRSLRGADLALGSVTGAEIADGSVARTDLAPGARSAIAATKAHPRAETTSVPLSQPPVFMDTPDLVTIQPGQSVTISGTFTMGIYDSLNVDVNYGMCSAFLANNTPALIGTTARTTGGDVSFSQAFVVSLASPADAPAVSVYVGPCLSTSAQAQTIPYLTDASYILNVTNP